MRVTHLKIAGALLFLVGLAGGAGWSSAAAGASDIEPPTVVAHGQAGSHSWYVEAFEEGSGICLEVSVFGRNKEVAESGLGQCSFPAKRRGIVLVAANRQRGQSRPSVMVLGGAFSPAVKRIVFSDFKGLVHRLTLRSAPAGAPSLLSQFHYASVAAHGPLCIERFTTLDRHNHPLWTVGWRVLFSDWRGDPSFNPAALCPRK